MQSDRPIHLDVGVPSGNAFEAQSDATGHGDARSQQQLADQGRDLRALLEQQRGAAADIPVSAPMASPFDLFRPIARAPQAEPAAAAPAPALEPTLEHMARRLLVGDGSQGRRGVQIQLDDPQLPGVTVDIFEEGGRLVIRFTCSQESARERLCAGARWFATSLAQRLQRDVRVQVQTDDPEDPCLLQLDADC
ncbi:MAG: hypothetical protein ABWY08_11925 [Comamonas sp.]